MTTEPTDLQDTIEILRRGIDEIARLIGEIPSAVDDFLHGRTLPPEVRDFVVRTADEAIGAVEALLDRIHQILVGVAAPFWFSDYAHRWEDVRGVTTGVTGALIPNLMPAAGTWTGDAAAAYDRAADPQRAATERLTTLITKIDSALSACARAGATFYLAVAVIVTILIADLLAALFTMITGIGVPVSLVALVGGAGTVAFLIIGAVTALGNLLFVQIEEMNALHGEAVDNSTFPGGHWPDPVTRDYTDATVTDGDADWSLRR